MKNSLVQILSAAVQKKASDVHLVVGRPPMVRIRGSIRPLEGFEVVSTESAPQLIYPVLLESQRKKFEQSRELDCSLSVKGLGRFRLNVFIARRGIEAVLRTINATIPKPADLELSPAIIGATKLKKGLVLVTGPTGSGKSTTLACLVDLINQTREDNILTIEDPIEFVYDHKKSIVRQREVGVATNSFANALKSSLREDPDVILLGEMRDLETISLALTASETGHLVFGTMHTTDAPQTIDRIIDVFPADQQDQVRVQLAASLKVVVSQTLVPTLDGKGRVAAREVMIVTPAISNLIRQKHNHMIYGAIETGMKHGMISLDKALQQLVKENKVSLEEARARSINPANFASERKAA